MTLKKDVINRATLQTTQKQAERCHKTTVDAAVQNMNHTDVQPMARTVYGVAESIIFNEYAGATEELCQKW